MASNRASHSTFPRSRAADDAVPAELVAAAASGDRAAQRQVYDRCHRQVYRLMVRMVGPQDALDVSQQVFLQLFRKLDYFSGRSSFRTWLYRLAMNEALQYLRKERRWSFGELAHDPEESQATTPATRQEQRELLQTALEQIDPELRSVFLLREQEEFSYREIAEIMAIPEGTVGSRLNRARSELKRALERLGWEA